MLPRVVSDVVVEANETDLPGQLPPGKLVDSSWLVPGLVPVFLIGGEVPNDEANLSVTDCAYDLAAALKLLRSCSGLDDPAVDSMLLCTVLWRESEDIANGGVMDVDSKYGVDGFEAWREEVLEFW